MTGEIRSSLTGKADPFTDFGVPFAVGLVAFGLGFLIGKIDFGHFHRDQGRLPDNFGEVTDGTDLSGLDLEFREFCRSISLFTRGIISRHSVPMVEILGQTEQASADTRKGQRDDVVSFHGNGFPSCYVAVDVGGPSQPAHPTYQYTGDSTFKTTGVQS